MENREEKNITAAAPGLAEISISYLEDFVLEIKEILDEVDLELVNLEMDPGNKDYINAIYCSFHTVKGLAGLINTGAGVKIATATEELLEAVRKYSPVAGKMIINLVLDSVSYLKKICEDSHYIEGEKVSADIENHVRSLERQKTEIYLESRQPLGKELRIGEILVEEGAIVRSDVEDVLRKQSEMYNKMKFGEIVLREKKVDASEIIKAIRLQKVRNSGVPDQYVKIPLERLDQIIGIINTVSGIYDSVRDEAVLRFGSNDSLTIEASKAFHLLDDVRSILKELRMVTLQQTFQKLTRVACSLIEEKHLEIMFSTMGENMEVDKEIADKISNPMGELVRLILEKAYSDGENREKKFGSLEIVAYEEADKIHIAITGDSCVDIEELTGDSVYLDAASKLKVLKCELSADDMSSEGIRVEIKIQR